MLYWPDLFNVDVQVLHGTAGPSLFKSTGTVVFLVLLAGMNLNINTDVKKHSKNSVILLS
jgi:hypothetical protein